VLPVVPHYCIYIYVKDVVNIKHYVYFVEHFLCLMHILNVQIYHVSAYSAIVLTYFGKYIRNPFENGNY
jgi:hypothetical protein